MFKISSLFSGIGAAEQAFKNLNINHSIELICEIDKYARETFLSNFKPNNVVNDIKELKVLPDLDFLIFGSPCTDFSQAGKRDLSSGRSILVINAINLILNNPPKYIIFENVKSILDKKNKDFFYKEIFDRLSGKYNVQFYILNALDFGIPHHRERLFLIAQRKDGKLHKEINFFYLIHKKIGNPKFGDIEDNNAAESYYLSETCQKRIINIENRAHLKGYGYKNTIIDGETGVFKNLDASYFKGPDGKRSVVMDSLTGKVRMATILECKRLMGFPDNFIVPVSKSQAYKQFGNSICVKILEEIIKEFK